MYVFWRRKKQLLDTSIFLSYCASKFLYVQ